MTVYYFEDLPPGRSFDLGSFTVSEAEIIEFARQYDPQPFHVDPEAAAASPFGGLIASGWHTCALYMRLYVDTILSRSDSRGSPGVEEVRWLAPVRPGDTLHGRVEIVEAKASEKDPTRGTVLIQSELRNQDDIVVMRMKGRGLFGRRPT